MKYLLQRLLVLIMIAALALIPVSRVVRADNTSKSGGQKVKRTILLYDCGADLETDAGLATYNLLQILNSSFSADDDVKFLVMTGGSHKWQIDSKYLVFPDGAALPNDAVVDYNRDNPEASTQLNPKSQISNVYNQIWEAKGIDAVDENGKPDGNAGKLVLLDGDGITGAENTAVKSVNELMSVPATLKAFINYGVGKYPAEKYDLILWDHGGGPKGGYGVDEHYNDSDDWTLPSIMSFAGIVDALSDNAVTNNDADGDGKKDTFDFIDFDACLMNSVELALAMTDYTDYYIASADVEPGYGQYYGPRADRDGKQYKGWLDELGNPDNDEKYNAPGGTYELGKVIVDDFYNFYEKESGDGYSQEGTLAIVDTGKLLSSQFVNTLNEMARVLKEEAANLEEDGLHFYDELKSYYNSLEYSDELFDLGNLAALLSVVNSEISEKNLDKDDDYYINCNNYHDISRTICQMLNPSSKDTFMYARGTSGISTKELYYRTLDDQLGYGSLGSSGMSIYFPGTEMTMSAVGYFKEIDPVIDRLPDNDKRKTLLKNYEATVAYYSMILYSGRIVSGLINDEEDEIEITNKNDVDYQMVMDRMKGIFGNWDNLIVPCMGKAGLNEENIDNWFRVLIPQQVEEAVDTKQVTLEKSDGQETGACTITINQAKKHIINSVERKIYVELPELDKYMAGLDPRDKDTVLRLGNLEAGSVKGKLVSQPEGNTIRDMIRWYQSSGGVWSVDPLENKWYVVSDADGTDHVASIYLSDEDGIYVPALVGTNADGPEKSRLLMLEFSNESDHKISSIYYMNTDTGPVRVEPKDLVREITVMPILYIRPMMGDDYYAPISRTSFTISADNAASLSLKYTDIDNIGDIGDTDGDGKVLDSTITIKDLYGNENVVSDRIHIKNARIKPAIRTGKEIVPEVVYLGETLKEGIDYIWEKESYWDKETGTLKEPDFIEPGDYKIIMRGKGRFRGAMYDIIFSIVLPEDEAAQLVEAAQSAVDKAKADVSALKPDASSEDIKTAYEKLVNAQQTLADAQEALNRTKAILSKEKQAQLEDEIAKLEKEIEDLNNQLAKAQVIDISNYEATLSAASFEYTGKPIEPSVKVSGLNGDDYTVSYSNNKDIGTGTVTIEAKGNKYKGKITKTFEITKKTNTLAVKGKTAAVKYKKLKKKAQKLKVTSVISFTSKGQGKKTYKLVLVKKGSKKLKKVIAINKRTGKVKVKKGLKKGVYKVKVKIKAQGDGIYKASAVKTVVFKIKVK